MKSGPYFVLTIGLAGDPVSESKWTMNDDERETYSGIKNCMRMTKKTEITLEEAVASVLSTFVVSEKKNGSIETPWERKMNRARRKSEAKIRKELMELREKKRKNKIL